MHFNYLRNYPLPYCDPVTGNYETKNTANARCEIQLNGNFGLGGGPANLPTETRPGNWYGKYTNYTNQNNIKTLTFLDDFNIHPGDIIAPATYNFFRSKILSYDPTTHSAIIENPQTTFSVTYWYSVSGGIVIHSLITNKNTPFINANTIGGTINLICENTSNQTINLFDNCCCNIKRCCSTIDITTSNVGTSTQYKSNSSLIGKTVSLKFDEVGAGYLTSDFGTRASSGAVNFIADLVVCGIIGIYNNNNNASSSIPIDQKILIKSVVASTSNANFALPMAKLGRDFEIRNSNISVVPAYVYSRKGFVHLVNCSNKLEQFVEKDGIVTRVLQSELPLTTDFSMAWHHVPINKINATWRYEDHFIRNGETFIFHCKFLPGSYNSVARIAITDDNYWYPISYDIIPPFVEYKFEKKNPLKWEYGNITYRNNSGYDCQIRFWEIVMGDTEGGYIKSWRGSGGIL